MSISVLPKRNIVLPRPDGRESVRLNKDVISQVPDWASKSPYYKALVSDKKLLVMTAEKKGKGGRKAEDKAAEKEERKAGDEAEEAADGDAENPGEGQESE